MTPRATAAASQTPDAPPSPEAVLLESLAAAGEALTAAIVRHDLDAIVAATTDAERLMGQLATREAVREAAAVIPAENAVDGVAPEPVPPDDAVLRLGARIGATARRNALLLEHAWATDAALLRLLATAARAEAEAAAGTGYGAMAPGSHPASEATPAGWLDRSA